MKSAKLFLAAVIFCAPAGELSAQSFFSKIKDKISGSPSGPPTNLDARESEASAEFAQAESMENSGKTGRAHDAYKSIAKSYPNTKVGAEAQFRVALIYDREGNGKKAYEEYETLITKYRGSPRFQQAIERQFAIAESFKTSNKKGLLGIGAGIQPSDLKGMYDKIAEAAPFTQYAPRSLMAIAELEKRDGENMSAIANYQEVVDNYRGTPYAKDAQYEIYKLRGMNAENSNSPSEDRAQVDAGLNFVALNPDDARADQVKAGLEQIEERSLEKMYHTGQFYEKSGNHKSAIVYYREIAKKPSSKYYQEATTRINEIEKILAGQAVEEKANRFGPLPSLPKIDRPRFRIGKKDEPEALPSNEIQLPGE